MPTTSRPIYYIDMKAVFVLSKALIQAKLNNIFQVSIQD